MDVDVTSIAKWTQAIEDAKAEIREAEKRIRGLNTAIEVFQRRRDSGEPWKPAATQN